MRIYLPAPALRLFFITAAVRMTCRGNPVRQGSGGFVGESSFFSDDFTTGDPAYPRDEDIVFTEKIEAARRKIIKRDRGQRGVGRGLAADRAEIYLSLRPSPDNHCRPVFAALRSSIATVAITTSPRVYCPIYSNSGTQGHKEYHGNTDQKFLIFYKKIKPKILTNCQSLGIGGDSACPRTAPALCDGVVLPSLELSLQRGCHSGGGRRDLRPVAPKGLREKYCEDFDRAKNYNMNFIETGAY